jgi:DNA (cytosine-5)-methyltransferase 1
MSLRYLSVCSGIEAATQAWHVIGWRPVAFSEIEAFPSAVLAHHYPTVPNWGDMTRYEDWPDADVDVLCGGTPCQSFSIAGLRQGLADPRGNLMLTFGAIARRYDARWLVWENVPGVLSSNGGRDFAAFLGLLGQLGYGWAYRVLDAQYTRTCRFPQAVPQRRRRVFVVGYLGDWRRAAAVLFDRESLSGHPAPRREAGQRPAPTLSARPAGGGGLGTDFDLDGGLIANSGDVGYCLTASSQQSLDAETETETLIAVAHALRGEGHDASEDGTGRGLPIIAIQERAVSENPDAGPDGVGVNTEGAAYTLEARTQVQAVAFAENQRGEVALSDVASQLNTGGGKPGQGYPAVAFSFKDYGNDATEEASPTLRSLGHYDANGGSQMAVAFDMRGREGGAVPEGPHDTANIRAADGGSSRSYVAQPWAVRRLTPVECERLQGFPDGFTAIPWRGKPADLCPDGPRYKALGNSWAVNVAAWVGERIAEVDSWGDAA